jgi:hypothetical protein
MDIFIGPVCIPPVRCSHIAFLVAIKPISPTQHTLYRYTPHPQRWLCWYHARRTARGRSVGQACDHAQPQSHPHGVHRPSSHRPSQVPPPSQTHQTHHGLCPQAPGPLFWLCCLLPAAAAAAGCAREIKRLKIERVCGTGGVASVYRAKSAAGCQNTTCPCSVLARTCRLSIDRRLPGLDHQLAVSHRARDLNYLEQHAFIPPSIHHGYRQARTSDRSREAACSA